jgi:hypothetical protein
MHGVTFVSAYVCTHQISFSQSGRIVIRRWDFMIRLLFLVVSRKYDSSIPSSNRESGTGDYLTYTAIQTCGCS